jgi:type I restriction enzyme S subunit
MTTTDEFVAYLNGRATGAAYPAVTPTAFSDAPAIIPSAGALAAFDDLVSPLMHLASRAATQSRVLGLTRDVLLPRLVSGNIDVSELNVAEAVA